MIGQEIEALVENLLVGTVPGFKVVRGRRPASGADIVADIDGHRIVVEIKAVRVSVVEDVLGRLAMAAAQARHIAADTQAISLAVVVVPSVGRKTISAAQEFMSTFMPEAGWGLIDSAGNVSVHIPILAIDVDRSVVRVGPASAGRTSISLFSDLNRWLLKVLLLEDAPERLWGGPRQQILSNRDLGRVAGVSPEMVRRFMTSFLERDFLRQTPDRLKIVRRSDLLKLWMADDVLTARQPVPVRRLVAGSGSLPDMADLPGFRDIAVVAGFEACRYLGLLHAIAPRQVEVYVTVPIPEAMRRFGLEKCSPADSDFRLVPTRHPRSILGGRLIIDGVPVVDAFQASLDVLRHPGRGREQSDYIINDVLGLGAVN